MPKWTDLDDAGVVNQDVDLAEAIDRLTDGRLNLAGIEQITLNRKRSTATSRQVSFLRGSIPRCPSQGAPLCRPQHKSAAPGPNRGHATHR